MSGRARVQSPDDPRWAGDADALPVNVSLLRRALVGFAAANGADSATQDAVALASSEALTNAVVHGFVGVPAGRMWVAARVAGGTLHVTITDDGRGTVPRPDSPGLGLGLLVIARLARGFSVDAGPGGRGTQLRLQFSLPA